MELLNFINTELIWVNSDCKQREDVFKLVAGRGEELGYVTRDFLSKIEEREKVFPTGLKLDGYGVAIPHTDPDCIIEQFIAVVTTQTGVPFQLMDNNQQAVNAEIIFVLGLNEPHNQLKVLQELTAMIQNHEKIHALLEANDKREIQNILEGIAI